MKKKIFIITFLCMIAFAAMIVSDKIYKSADMTERVLEDNSISKYTGKVAIPINGNKSFCQQRNIRQNRLKIIVN